jgi:methylenetetrahydrofolate dehydrogenase (NADP+) / methenyltetrahydrofolate cyclohydrolase
MSARLLEGRPVAEAIWRDVEQRASAFRAATGRAPRLALVSGSDAAAAAYARQIERQLGRHGLSVVKGSFEPSELVWSVRALGSDVSVDGIVVLTPLPEGVSAEDAALAIEPYKDVDGQHPQNLGRLAQRRPAFAPATAVGGLRLLEHYGVPLAGTRAVVVGRSPVVGMPLALLLMDANATVSVCHTRTTDLAHVTREADVLCVAVGRPRLIGPEHVRPGAIVVDFGTNPAPDGATLGDVQTEGVREVASALTPVPGGTGPITVAVLAEQTVRAAELRINAD